MAFGIPVVAALAAAGTAVEIFGTLQQGKYQAAVAKNNAQIAEANAGRESDAAQIEQMRSDREYSATLASQVASAGASGLDIGSASFARGRQLTRRSRGEAAQDINRRGTTAARNYLQESANFMGEASAAKKQSQLSALGSAFSGAANIMGSSMLSSGNRSGGRRPWDSGRPNWYGRG